MDSLNLAKRIWNHRFARDGYMQRAQEAHDDGPDAVNWTRYWVRLARKENLAVVALSAIVLRLSVGG